MNNSKLLITGDQGFIGTNLKDYLDQKDMVDFCGWDINSRHDIFSPRFEEYVKSSDVVIHLAALTSVEQSFKNPSETYRVNVLGTSRVVELCVKYKKKLIFPSSAAVYHPELSPYADSKAIAESIVQRFMDRIPIVIFRFFNVYGPGMNPNSGSIMYNFLTSPKLVVFGDGEQTRDFIHVDDVCAIVTDAIKNKWNGQIVDIGTGQAYSANYVAGLFAFNRNLKIEYKTPRREIKWSIANVKPLKMLYGKPLKTNLEKDIKRLCEEYYE